jgi:outer membrane murein-binding lipoprotein Lpp
VSTRVDVEEIETTKSEKLLAAVLAIFVLIGGIWTYQKIDDYVADWLAPSGEVELSAQDESAIAKLEAAEREAARADEAEARAGERMVLAREAYRTALDAGQPAEQLRLEYERAQAEHEQARAELEAASARARAARPAANLAFRHQEEALREQSERHELAAFLFRLGFVLGLLALSYWLLGRLRTRRSRYLPTAIAFVASTALLALFMAGDYITDYVDPLDLGPLVLSLAGIAVTLFAFAALQRYLAKRVPIRRVRRQECPFCGYPVRGNGHCEGCGRPVVADCATCSAPRRVGTLHCGVCGHA